MKLYIYIVLLLAGDVALFATILPTLFSAESYEAVWLGFLLIALVPPCNYYGIKKIITMAKPLFNRSNTNESTD